MTGLTALVLATALSASAAPAPLSPVERGPAGMRFAAAQRLAAAGLERSTMSVAGGMDASGRALLVWDQRTGRGVRSRLAVATATRRGRFGRARALGRGGNPEAAVGAAGHAVVASWRGPRASDGAAVIAGRVTGRFGRPRLLAARQVPSAVVVAGDGTAAVLLGSDRGPATVRLVGRDGRPGASVQIASEGAPGTLAAGADGTIAVLSGRGTVLERRPGDDGFTREIRLDAALTGVEATDDQAAPPQVAVGRDGRIAVVALRSPTCVEENGCFGGVAFAERRAGAAEFGPAVDVPVATYRTGAGTIKTAFSPSVTYDAAGRATVVWGEDDYVCPECDMDAAKGAVFAWGPHRARTALARDAGAILVTPVAGGIAVVSEGARRRALWFLGANGARRLATPPLGVWSGDPLVAGGGRRLLLATANNTPLRAILGTATRR